MRDHKSFSITFYFFRSLSRAYFHFWALLYRSGNEQFSDKMVAVIRTLKVCAKNLRTYSEYCGRLLEYKFFHTAIHTYTIFDVESIRNIKVFRRYSVLFSVRDLHLYEICVKHPRILAFIPRIFRMKNEILIFVGNPFTNKVSTMITRRSLLYNDSDVNNVYCNDIP